MSELGCPATWGNCVEGDGLRIFGQPTATPHACKGVSRHKSKLHFCQNCGRPGHRIAPSPYSKAGRQFRSILQALERGKA